MTDLSKSGFDKLSVDNHSSYSNSIKVPIILSVVKTSKHKALCFVDKMKVGWMDFTSFSTMMSFYQTIRYCQRYKAKSLDHDI